MGELLIAPTSEDVARFADGGASYTPVLNPEDHLQDLYEMFLQAVQQGKVSHSSLVHHTDGIQVYDRRTVFEKWLRDCLMALRGEIEAIEEEYARGKIDLRWRAHFLKVREMSESAIRKYLELPDRKRLIGI